MTNYFDSDDFKVSSTASTDTETGFDMVATIIPPKGEPQTLLYDPTTPSGIIVQDSTSYVNAELQPEYMEAMTETVERSRGLIEGGFKFAFKLPESLGGFEFNLERKPRKETKTIKKAIYRPQEPGLTS